MKEQILELIHKELENVDGKKIFHQGPYTIYYLEDYSPVRTLNLESKVNCDTRETIKPEVLDFCLRFEDGEPDIMVYTTWKEHENKRLYKTKYFGLRKFWEYTYTYNFITKVTCGHISYQLSENENDELLKLTKKSYEKYLSLKESIKDKEVSKKIKKRLKKYKNKLGQ
jgi:hypothetical protein